MSAGTGITHSEFNPSATDLVHLYQIWLLPERKGIEPSYEQKAFPAAGRLNEFRLVASRDGRDGSLTIHTDAAIYLAEMQRGRAAEYPLAPDRHAWLQVLRGHVSLQGLALEPGDGVAASGESSLRVEAGDDAEVMLFDLA